MPRPFRVAVGDRVSLQGAFEATVIYERWGTELREASGSLPRFVPRDAATEVIAADGEMNEISGDGQLVLSCQWTSNGRVYETLAYTWTDAHLQQLPPPTGTLLQGSAPAAAAAPSGQ